MLLRNGENSHFTQQQNGVPESKFSPNHHKKVFSTFIGWIFNILTISDNPAFDEHSEESHELWKSRAWHIRLQHVFLGTYDISEANTACICKYSRICNYDLWIKMNTLYGIKYTLFAHNSEFLLGLSYSYIQLITWNSNTNKMKGSAPKVLVWIIWKRTKFTIWLVIRNFGEK